ncbi:MAG: hypothetical protein WC335_06810, partial [Candidatus Omnitrophota bacterium]
VDLAGNIAVAVVNNINIDKTAPVITASRNPDPNANGWNNTDVTVAYMVSDALSGVDTVNSDSGDDVVSTEGYGQSASGMVMDKAGNTATATINKINIDKTAPIITAGRDPLPNANGWNNTNVTVSYLVSDALSGVDNDVSDYAADVIAAEGAGQSASGTVVDLAGNIAVAVVNNINIDKTPPVITASRDPASNVNGWNNTDVSVAYMVSDALSGVDAANSDFGTDVVATEGAGQSTSGMVTDLAGNTATVTVDNINVDKTPPVITVTAPEDGKTYDSTQTLDYDVSDFFDPKPVTEGPLSGTTYPDGTYEITIRSTDQAGNSTLKVLRFSIGGSTVESLDEGIPFDSYLPRYIPPYLEQIQPFRINPYINISGVGNQGLVYFYHPLTVSDYSAFDSFILEEGAYEFIDNSINLKGHDNLLPILENAKKKKKQIS